MKHGNLALPFKFNVMSSSCNVFRCCFFRVSPTVHKVSFKKSGGKYLSVEYSLDTF
jgi:hypothetical protein